MITPLAQADSLRIGSVDFVSPDEVKVLLDIEAPNDVALNAGIPRPFPRINSYVLIPSDSGFLVAQIEWITIERSQYPKRKGMQDFGVIDLPYPLRKMSLNPLGILKENVKNSKGETNYAFSRGVEVYPTVGDPVLLPSQTQLKAIVESGENRRVNIGISPLAGNAVVSIDPDRLFGRHLAILGNTGSGKSCSVAGVIRWSIEAAKKQKINNDASEQGEHRTEEIHINTRFIILDPNGEYSKAFSELENVNLYAVEADEANGVNQLHVPIWFWNSAEWSAFTQASSKTQRPTLIQALRSVRDGQLESALTPSNDMRRFLRTLVSTIVIERNAGSPWGRFPQPKAFFEKIQKWQDELIPDDLFTDTEKTALSNLKEKVNTVGSSSKSTIPNLGLYENRSYRIIAACPSSSFCFWRIRH
ncbi:MAG: helicase HerA domain-containing protein [Desulfitobacteriaceae bacterium]